MMNFRGTRRCRKCGLDTQSRLFLFVNHAGNRSAAWGCERCGGGTAGRFYSVRGLPEEEVARLPVIDRRTVEDECERCGKLGAEAHHWAPTHIWGSEASDWPISRLCKECHDLWHRVMTPDMNRKQDADARDAALASARGEENLSKAERDERRRIERYGELRVQAERTLEKRAWENVDDYVPGED